MNQMLQEFLISATIVLLICLEIFAFSQVIRILERRRSTILPGYIRDFDDTPSPKRKRLDSGTMHYLSIISMAGGGIIMAVNLSQLLFLTGIIFLVFGAILQILILKSSKTLV